MATGDKVKDAAGAFAAVCLGNVLYALTVKLFLLPSGLMTGGATGIALVVNRYTGFSLSAFILLFNAAMLVLGFFALGKSFVLGTLTSALVYPLALAAFERLFGDLVLTEDLLLNTLFSGLGTGVSLGIAIRAGASTGGTDIPCVIAYKLFRIPVSWSMWASDIVILLFQAMYQPMDAILYGIAHVILYSIVLDRALLLGASRTEVRVVSEKAEEIRREIIRQVDRGVTLLSGESGYLRQETQVVVSVVANRELPRLERLIHRIDPDCFMVICKVSEVQGRGFTTRKQYVPGSEKSGE